MKNISLFLILTGSIFTSIAVQATPMLVGSAVPGGYTGATGFVVNGMDYSVKFVDGSCIDIFSGCDSNEDFAIPGADPEDLAFAFYEAFIADKAEVGTIDANPSFAYGCQNLNSDCLMTSPIYLPIDFPAVVRITGFNNAVADEPLNTILQDYFFPESGFFRD